MQELATNPVILFATVLQTSSQASYSYNQYLQANVDDQAQDRQEQKVNSIQWVKTHA